MSEKYATQEDLSKMDWILLACCPVDRSNLPQGPELDSIVITDLYTVKECENDNCPFGKLIWVGPRQMEAYKKNEEKTLLLCYICAIAAHHHMTGEGFDGNLVTLGGGSTEEGRPRLG